MPTIYWAGDSTVQFNDETTFPQTGIGQVFNLYVKPGVNISNHAKNGRSTKSFIDESRLVPIYDKITEGDFLFIQFGHNDEKINDPNRYTEASSEYKINLCKFITVAKNKKAIPVLITPLMRRQFNPDGSVTDGGHGEYVKAMRQVADKQQVALVDLWSRSRDALLEAGPETTKKWYVHVPAGVYPNFMEGKADDTHLQKEGAVIFAGLIADGLRELGGIYKDLLKA
ncbi:MAG: rhamnogalacturonan acetylesterase [Pseudobutyrivibrio sp.]|nr:rhamnogalacturonan acetylesterase [Pseudobutyrivibrio sp.]